jgi:hypothetical protein
LTARGALAAIVALVSLGASAAEPAAAQKNWSFTFEPAVIDAKNATGSTLGFNYKYNGALLNRSLDANDAGADRFDPNATIGKMTVVLSGAGTATVARERNPRNFLELLLDAKADYTGADSGSFRAGAFVKAESDQSFDNKQGVFGVGATYGKLGVLASMDFFAVDLKLGRVDPKDDTERKKLAAANSLDSYYRWNLELLYMLPINSDAVRAFELNYRDFLERNPPSAIRAAGLDRHQLATIRLGFKNDLFVAFSSGKLPFDRKNDKALQVGWSYKLK